MQNCFTLVVADRRSLARRSEQRNAVATAIEAMPGMGDSLWHIDAHLGIERRDQRSGKSKSIPRQLLLPLVYN